MDAVLSELRTTLKILYFLLYCAHADSIQQAYTNVSSWYSIHSCLPNAVLVLYHYSTVTDFARFLGLSTSQPLPKAT